MQESVRKHRRRNDIFRQKGLRGDRVLEKLTFDVRAEGAMFRKEFNLSGKRTEQKLYRVPTYNRSDMVFAASYPESCG